MRRSRAGIQLGAKWQFWKKTHLPLSMELRIMASARGPLGTGGLSSRGCLLVCPFIPFLHTSAHPYLALAQGDGRELLGELHLFGKLVEVSGGISARREHKDEGCDGIGVFEHGRQVGRLRDRERKWSQLGHQERAWGCVRRPEISLT